MKVKENNMNPNVKYRRYAVISLVIILALLSLFFYRRHDREEKTLYLFNWTSYTPQSVIDEFEEEFGVTVVTDNFSSNEEMFSKLLSGAKGYDVIFPSQNYTSILIKLDMLEKLDHSKLPNLQYISPFVLEKSTYDENMQFSVPYYMGAAGIGVNKAKVSQYDKSFSIFSRSDLKNTMTLMDDMREVLGDSLAFNGFSVNSTDDEELKIAEDTIVNDWKPNIVKWDSDGFARSFAAGDFSVVQGYAEVIFSEIAEEDMDKIDFFIPEEGSTMYIDSMCIPKGAKNIDLALEFINFIQRPEIYAQFLDEFGFPSTVNTEAEKFMTTTPYYQASELKNCELMEDLGNDTTKYNEIWQDVRFRK
jgi:spermidine/putrescine transport system substrate-binding protein